MSIAENLYSCKAQIAMRPTHHTGKGVIRFGELNDLPRNRLDIGTLVSRAGDQETDFQVIGQFSVIVKLFLRDIRPLQIVASQAYQRVRAGGDGRDYKRDVRRQGYTLIFQVDQRLRITRILRS